MRSADYLSRTDSRPPAKERERPVDRRHARQFRDLLGDLPDPIAADVALYGPPASPSVISTENDDALEAAGAHPRFTASGEMGAHRVLSAAINNQTLTLRATSGPLAGMLIQAELRDKRLNLRLSAPEGPLAARLSRHHRQLQSALSAALGVDVVVDVHHEN